MIRHSQWQTRAGHQRIIADVADTLYLYSSGRFSDAMVQAHGSSMRRRLIKSRDRYIALRPVRIRTSRLHQAYRQRQK